MRLEGGKTQFENGGLDGGELNLSENPYKEEEMIRLIFTDFLNMEAQDCQLWGGNITNVYGAYALDE